MHTVSLAGAAALPATPPTGDHRPPPRLMALFRRQRAAGTRGIPHSSRAATLPLLDDLHEACAPEGALYVDGVLFGGR